MDYRAALRERTGVGEYTYQLATSLLALAHGNLTDFELTLFSSSAKDRLRPDSGLAGAKTVESDDSTEEPAPKSEDAPAANAPRFGRT